MNAYNDNALYELDAYLGDSASELSEATKLELLDSFITDDMDEFTAALWAVFGD